MKKHYISFIVLFAALAMLSCNENGKSKSETATPEVNTPVDTAAKSFNFSSTQMASINRCMLAGGMANFIIEESAAKQMMNDFDRIYKKDDAGKPVNALLNNYWIDSCTIYRIASFLRTSKKHDGIRIYLACAENENPQAYPGEQYKNKSSLAIFPTKFRTNPGTGKSTHSDDRIAIPLPGCSSGSEFIKAPAVANPMIAAFSKVYRKDTKPQSEQKDSLSVSVWIDSCVVFALEDFIKNNPAHLLDGAHIKLAAYSSKDQARRPSQKHHKQSTLIIVPTNPGRGGLGHEDNWHIIDAFIKEKNWAPPGGLNHGELCPQKCD